MTWAQMVEERPQAIVGVFMKRSGLGERRTGERSLHRLRTRASDTPLAKASEADGRVVLLDDVCGSGSFFKFRVLR